MNLKNRDRQDEFFYNKSYSRWAKIVPKTATFFALLYHISVLFLFLILKVYPLFFFNIASVLVFSILLIYVNKKDSFIGLYLIASVEVIIHQFLADYFLGSETNFHFFILLMGLLPYLVFKGKFKIAIPITVLTSTLFIYLNNAEYQPKYNIDYNFYNLLKYGNIILSVLMIIIIMFVFTYIVFQSEKELRKRNDFLANEIQRASVIQQSFFRQNLSGIKNFDVAYFNKSLVGVSGDLYDFYRTGNKLEGLGIFDVSGHGISSSLVTMLVKNIIHQEFYKNINLDLWEILNNINDRVIEEKGNIENYLTGILVRINNSKIEFVCAGHPDPILYKKSTRKCSYLKKSEKSKGAIGLPDFPTYYESQYLEMETGDEMVFYSDGIIDACNEEGIPFGKEELLKAVAQVSEEAAAKQVALLTLRIENYCGKNPLNDDITIIVLKK